MVDVGGDDQPADRDLVAHQLGGQLFAVRDEAHCVGDFAPTRVMHLGACCLFHIRLPTPVLTGSGSEGLSQPRGRAAPLSGVESIEREPGRGKRERTWIRAGAPRFLSPVPLPSLTPLPWR